MKTLQYIVLNERELIQDNNTNFTQILEIDGYKIYTADRIHKIKDNKLTMSKQMIKKRYVPLYIEINNCLVRSFNTYGWNDLIIESTVKLGLANIDSVSKSVGLILDRVDSGFIKVIKK